MTNYPLVSVIVPVYNVEDYVEECVESILAQDYPNLEVILVDDGATDSSGAICDRLGGRDGRIAVYHKENGGLSDARNYGLARCQGEWISFVDSDDYVSPVFISALYQAAVEHGCSIAAVPGGKNFRDGESCNLVEAIRPVTLEAPRGAPGHSKSLSNEVDEVRPVAPVPP